MNILNFVFNTKLLNRNIECLFIYIFYRFKFHIGYLDFSSEKRLTHIKFHLYVRYLNLKYKNVFKKIINLKEGGQSSQSSLRSIIYEFLNISLDKYEIIISIFIKCKIYSC